MKQWRVGSISMGFLLIFLGLLLLGNTIWDIAIEEIVIYGWPVILILLGLEVLIYSFIKKDGPLRFDFFSIFILILAIMFTFVVYSIQTTGILPAIKGVIHDQSYTIEVDRSLKIPDSVEEIVIESVNGDIDITGKDTDTTSINGSIRIGAASQEEANKLIDQIFSVQIIGNKALIKVEQVNNFSWLGRNSLRADLSVISPKDKFIKTKLINGDIQVSNMEKSGIIDGVNGKIVLENNSGNFEVKTINGKLYLENTNGDLYAKTINGEIVINEIAGKLTVETINGDIEVNSAKVLGDWKINTTNGEITLDIPSNTEAKITGKSSIGKVIGDISWEGTDNSDSSKLGSYKEAVLGQGTYTIDLKSQHGEIEVNVN